MSPRPRLARRMRLRLAIVVAGAALPIPLWAVLPLPSRGAQAPESRAASLQPRIDQTRASLGRKRGTERVLSSDIAAWSQRIARVQAEITRLEHRQARIQADLDAKRAELARIQENLRYERARLARLRARLAQARVVLARRLVAIYKADNPDIVSVIRNAHVFADLIERSEFMRRVSDQDQRIIILVRTAKADATATAARLSKLEARQQRVTEIVYQRRQEVASVKRQLVGKRVGYARTRTGKARALASVRSDRQHLQAHLDDLESAATRVAAELR